ncbi:MAG TPA: glycosyltransferase family 4 protein [Solirubrobacteraceae bacterium]|jgi:glycosyltransferase involved in cell wall biosynthesis|nr:glycosyltransferase family 4 protein [Solirubrobacteraceae bacterium]
MMQLLPTRASSERADARHLAPSHAPCSDVTIVANDVGAVGGMERQLAELAVGLSRLGHNVTVIARTCELPEGAEVSFHRVWGPRRPFLIAYLWFLLAGSVVVWRRRRGIVQTAGAVVLNRVDTITVHCCHQVYGEAPSANNSLARGYARLARRLKQVAERLCFRINDRAALVCVSNGVAEEIREHYPNAEGRVMTIHNGVDLAAFARGARRHEALALRASLAISEGTLVLAFVGGNWEQKGLRSVIEALPRAPGWDLVVAGHGSTGRFQELARSLAVEARVHWLGVMRDIQVVYELADAFVLPSSYETFSLVTFEAAAYGLPILATAVSGVRELIEDGRTGFLITPDPAAIAERLLQLAADPALRTRLGRAARESSLGFGWDKMVASHHELYARLAADSQP